MGKQTYTFDVIEREIADVFRRLGETMPNVSFVYSYAYATTKDPKTAEVKGRVNLLGSKEEVEAHMAGLSEMITKEATKKESQKNKVYGNKKN